MQFRTLDNPKSTRFLIVMLWGITAGSCVLFINNHLHTLALEKELDRIDHELHFKQVIHDRRMREYEQQAKKRKEQVEALRSEILSKLKRENENRY
ncbi:hypothetical protein LPB248_06630 [Flavobacterium sp. LPB0248]|uniref:hypothetical protein n=1 Tax=Flavobacterium sp. LPB0248 TaxID=2614441 RepID=UPI0015A58F72|nr:hypothetical protein [Flavobacterium sp. LPB0248]QLC65964.1 hypothetical protein LPB248_06630 [Flavobacterium sp. LPB0248]